MLSRNINSVFHSWNYVLVLWSLVVGNGICERDEVFISKHVPCYPSWLLVWDPLDDYSYPILSPWVVTWVRLECWNGREMWQNKEAPEQDAGRAGLMGCSALAASKCLLLHACPFLNSPVSALSTEFAFCFA